MIEIRDVNKSFGALHVLKGIDLTVDHGEVLCLIGASGSGEVDPPAVHQCARTDRQR